MNDSHMVPPAYRCNLKHANTDQCYAAGIHISAIVDSRTGFVV